MRLWKGWVHGKYEVLYYETSMGEVPVLAFIDAQTPNMQAKIMRSIGLLVNNGAHLREPHSKKLTEAIFELRIQAEGNHARILYFFVKGQTIILTNGFIKKTQKTPRHELDKADRYRKQYLASSNDG